VGLDRLVVGLDLGTTRCKAVAVAPDGQVAGSAASAYPLHSTHPGWAEQSAQEVWQGAASALRELCAQVPAAKLAGISLSGAMHSLLPVDAAGEPLALASTWADQRAAPQAEQLRLKGSQAENQGLYQRTGCPLQANYHVAKLLWWHEAAPEIARRAARFVTLKDYVLWRLAGLWATDQGMASTTGLFDIHRLAWDETALGLAGVTTEHLPALVPPAQVAGAITLAAAAATGLPAGLPVAPGSSDGGTANLGSGAVQAGQSVITMGTSGAVRRVVAQPLLDPQQRTWCYVLLEGRWFAGGAINNAGLALQWVRERFYADVAGDEGYQRLSEEAAGVAPGAEGVQCLPYFTGERSPHWNSAARALMSGLGLEHTRAHVARAVMEGVAYCLADVWEVLIAEAPGSGEVRLTGNVTHNPVWAQIVADVLGVPLSADEAADASALGAALLGHLALGHVARLEDAAAGLPAGTPYQPDPQRHEFYRSEHAAFQDLYRRLEQPVERA
jgi:gluconokinase